jgi:hypothetical protein
MPGTVRGELFEMTVEDALTICVALDDTSVVLHIAAEELAELRAVARAVVEASADDVVRRYAKQQDVGLRVVK